MHSAPCVLTSLHVSRGVWYQAGSVASADTWEPGLEDSLGIRISPRQAAPADFTSDSCVARGQQWTEGPGTAKVSRDSESATKGFFPVRFDTWGRNLFLDKSSSGTCRESVLL